MWLRILLGWNLCKVSRDSPECLELNKITMSGEVSRSYSIHSYLCMFEKSSELVLPYGLKMYLLFAEIDQIFSWVQLFVPSQIWISKRLSLHNITWARKHLYFESEKISSYTSSVWSRSSQGISGSEIWSEICIISVFLFSKEDYCVNIIIEYLLPVVDLLDP